MSTFFNTHCMEKNAKTDKEAHIARQGKLCQWYDIRYGNSFYGVESIDVARRLWGTVPQHKDLCCSGGYITQFEFPAQMVFTFGTSAKHNITKPVIIKFGQKWICRICQS